MRVSLQKSVIRSKIWITRIFWWEKKRKTIYPKTDYAQTRAPNTSGTRAKKWPRKCRKFTHLNRLCSRWLKHWISKTQEYSSITDWTRKFEFLACSLLELAHGKPFYFSAWSSVTVCVWRRRRLATGRLVYEKFSTGFWCFFFVFVFFSPPATLPWISLRIVLLHLSTDLPNEGLSNNKSGGWGWKRRGGTLQTHILWVCLACKFLYEEQVVGGVASNFFVSKLI